MSAPATALDRVVDVVPGVRAVALVNVPLTLTVFDTHFPRFPVLPGVLLLDHIGTTARLLAPPGLHHQHAVRGVRFRHYVQPGDQIRITVEVVSTAPEVIDCRAVAEVDGRAAATVRSLRLGADISEPGTTGESDD
ncbi:3-hydroxyacyl-ACP dehydratase FabZ family protein [Nocardia cyriacigeorgica]|uniref:3-hydroxyacyl-ACP dehydratase FabZ family protein n=1 Tax=Nocardia cyriacigeorgica TaxID=135487 RepID=UPI002455087F|nr:hypothetical protein [Nocardia cyriacigeorgica]BDU07933.1 hypothetical protein FMUBM48_41960 [Nocardia cyriacigeorgica]